MTVGELLDRISSSELTEWHALYDLEAAEHAEAEKRAERKGRR
jgi:hypothetical protein